MKRFLGELREGRLHGTPAAECYGHFQVLWRGFLANRQELIREARLRGAGFIEGSEGQLLALASQWWGTDLQSKVHGEYSVAIFDEQTRTLVLTHDALGLLPLFYADLPQKLCFASHLEDLVQELGADELDDDYIADFLARSSHVGERTPYRRLKQLRPGHTLVSKDGRVADRCTWDLREVQPLILKDDLEYAERLREVVQTSVEAAISTTGPTWSECSGGLDSSTVASVAAQSETKDLAVVSTVFNRCRQADESKWTQEVVNQYQLPWHRVDGDDSLPFSELPDRFVAEPGLPIVDWGVRQTYERLLEAHGVETLLTGQGGDLVFFGSGAEPVYLADLALRRPFHLLAEVQRWRRADRERRSTLYWFANFVARPALRHLVRRPIRSVGQKHSPWIHGDYARRMGLKSRIRRSVAPHGATAAEQWFREHLALVCGLAANQNQSTVRFDYRHPLLDRRLVEFVYAVPWEAKMSPGADRVLQRRALESILPEKIRTRRSKAIMDQPVFEGLRRSRAWLDLLTNEPRIVERGIVDAKRWSEAVAQARMGRTFHLPQFEAACTLEIWLRQFDCPASHIRRERTFSRPRPTLTFMASTHVLTRSASEGSADATARRPSNSP